VFRPTTRCLHAPADTESAVVLPNPLGQPDLATLRALGEPFRHVRADLCERGVDVLPDGRF